MIINARSARISYSADSVAHSLRSVIAPTTPAAPARRAGGSAAAGSGDLNLEALYPALFAARESQPALPLRAIRGLAFRASVLGSSAAMIALIALLHH